MCPMTRAPIASVLAVPSILDDPQGWFAAVDIDGDGRLSVLEVIECLKAQLPVDNSALDAAAADTSHWMWQQWDSDRSGFIERDELLQPQVRPGGRGKGRELLQPQVRPGGRGNGTGRGSGSARVSPLPQPQP